MFFCNLLHSPKTITICSQIIFCHCSRYVMDRSFMDDSLRAGGTKEEVVRIEISCVCAQQRLGPSDVGNVCVAGHESRLGLLLVSQLRVCCQHSRLLSLLCSQPSAAGQYMAAAAALKLTEKQAQYILCC